MEDMEEEKTNETDRALDDKDERNAEQASSNRDHNRKDLANISLMALCLFGAGLSASLLAPFFPAEALRRGLSASFVGYVLGAFPLTVFTGSLVAGQLLNHHGPRFMIGAGTLLAGSARILFGTLGKAPLDDMYLVLCFACIIVEGIGVSMYITASYAVGASLFPNGISFAYAMLDIAFFTGCMIGPTLGGALFVAGGFLLPFCVVGTVLLGIGIIAATWLSVDLSEQDRNNENNLEEGDRFGIRQCCRFYFSSLELRICFLTMSMLAVIAAYQDPTLALHLQAELGVTNPVTVGLVFLAGAISYTITVLTVGYFIASQRNYVHAIMLTGAALTTSGFVIVGPIPWLKSLVKPSLGLTVVSIVIINIGKAAILNPIPTAIFKAAISAGYKENLRTSGMVASIYNATWNLGFSVGMLLAGTLMDHVGFAWGSFVMVLIGLAVMALISLGMVIRYFKHPNDEPSIYKYDSNKNSDDSL